MTDIDKIIAGHREILARRIGGDIVAAIEMLIGLGAGRSVVHEFKTVDGHCFTVNIEYDGYEGMATLRPDIAHLKEQDNA